jgi:hypothetical protein
MNDHADKTVVDLAKARELRDQERKACGCSKCDPEADRTIREWINRQPWWNHDMVLTHSAIHYHGHLRVIKPSMTIHENLAATERFLKSEFPDKFQASTA